MSKPISLSFRTQKVLDKLSKGVNFSVTRRSILNLQKLAENQPIESAQFFDTLENMGGKVEKLSVPPAIIPKALAKMGEPEFLEMLINDKGELYVRRAASELVTKERPKTLQDYKNILIRHRNEKFKQDDELAYLFLYKAILKARVKLFKEGEERSAAKKATGIAPKDGLERIKDFLDFLARYFPFGTTGNDDLMLSELQIATLRLETNNNPAVSGKLTSLAKVLDEITNQQATERVNRTDPSIKGKIEYLKKGKWKVHLSGYRSTGTGIQKKEKNAIIVDTRKLISLFQHIIESNDKEHAANKAVIEQMKMEDFDLTATKQLYEAYKRIDEPKKDKARFEMEAIIDLIAVGSDQATELARSLKNCAVRNLELRQKELESKQRYFTRLISEAEWLIQAEITVFALSIAEELLDLESLNSPNKLERIGKRLGGFLGTFLKGEMREEWLKKVKSRVTGVLKAMDEIKEPAARKQKFIDTVNGLRNYYQQEWNKIWKDKGGNGEKHAKAAQLKNEVYQKIKEAIQGIEKIDQELADRLLKAGRFILLAKYEYMAHKQEIATEEEFLAKYDDLLTAFNNIQSHLVKVTDHGGVELGRATIADAEAMQLHFE